MFSRRRQRQRIVLAFIAVLGILAGAYTTFDGSFDTSLQALVYDFVITNAPAKVKNQITVVAIDDRTIAQYGRYPVPRRAYADALGVLKKANTTVIGFDIAFYDPSADPEDDRMLAAAIKETGNVVLAMQGASGISEADYEISFKTMQLPIPIFREAARDLAAVNIFPDPDSRVRDAAVVVTGPEGRFYSLPVVVAARHFRVDPSSIQRVGDRLVILTRLGAKIVPIDRFSGMPIYFASPPATSLASDAQRQAPCRLQGEFCIVSLTDLVAGKVPSNLLTGRAVIIGYHSVSAIPDDYPVPNSSFAKMFGVEIWANAAQTIFTDRYPLRHQSEPIQLGSIAFFVVTGVALVARFRLFGFLGALLLFLVYAFASVTLFVVQNSGDLGPGKVEAPSIGYVAPSVFWWIVALGYLLVEEQRSVARTQDTFGRFVTPSVARTILERQESGHLDLGGEEKQVTVLFGDIRGFTTMSEGMAPKALLDTLNRYFDGIVSVVNRFEGTVNKYNGDNIMVIWNAPLPVADHARKAVSCALEIQRWIVAERAKGGPDVSFGFGINTGAVVAGFLGAKGRMEYTVIGDTANVASRLTSSDIARRDQVAVSGEMLAALGPDAKAVDLGAVVVKGRAEPVGCYQIDRLGEIENPNPAPPPEKPIGVAAAAGFH